MIKSELIENKVVEKSKYPYIGYSAHFGLTVLFIRKNEGTVIHIDEFMKTGFTIGQFSVNWTEEEYSPITHTIKLTNGE
jgi:hypothetical protein